MSNTANAIHVWLKATCGDDSYREIARRAGLSDSIISRQIREQGHLGYEVAAGIARAYDAPVLGALIANTLLSPEEAGSDTVEAVLSTATDEQLVLEVARRLDVPDANAIFDAPVSTAVKDANVTHLDTRRNVRAFDDDEAVARPRDPEPTDEQ
jgi:hypothetical protein